ncbi:MAG: sigma-70 family RNA polymerase sigma factor [Planctomycetes bacterium]|nr:sigma-70 family RNA polymerase sigma factor [Planctomycetota bacterium]
MSKPTDVQDQNRGERDEAGAEDARLVGAALADAPGAFDDLVRRYQRRAVAVAYRLLGNAHDAADVAQDAYLRAFRSLGSLEDRRRFGPWLMRIVSNLSLNYRRSRQTGVARQAAALDEVAETPDGFRTPTGELRTGDQGSTQDGRLGDTIRAAIERLPDKQRLALVLFSIEGLPQKEVAEIMECSIELVKWNVFQARKTLRKELGEQLPRADRQDGNDE